MTQCAPCRSRLFNKGYRIKRQEGPKLTPLLPLVYLCTFINGWWYNYKNRSNYDTSNRFGTNTLWGSLFKKITRATQNFNMAAIFQDGCQGVSWNVIFALKMAVNGQKRLLWQHSVCFDHVKCTINVINTIQMFRLFQYGRQFPRWPPWAIA